MIIFMLGLKEKTESSLKISLVLRHWLDLLPSPFLEIRRKESML